MIAAIVDHPWPLAENLVGESGGIGVLQEFTAFVKTWNLSVVPFLERKELDALWQQKDNFRRRGILPRAIGDLYRIAGPFVREAVSTRTASVIDGPGDHGLSWRRALCDALGDAGDCRTPQIVYSGSQSPRWSPPRAAVDIQIDALNGDPPSEVVTRALVALDGYSDHPYAPIDCDPWRTFSWRNRPSLSSGPQDPCFLPEPSVIASLPVDRWETVLRAERAHSWGKGGRWVFVPPSDWRVDDGATGTWRNGAAFRCETAPGGNHHGPVDCHGRIWEWDTVKRHWDVQLKDGRHIRINSYGVWIDASG